MSSTKQKNIKTYKKYRDSGVNWLGKIPEEWKMKKLKYVCNSFADYGLNIKAEEYQSEGIRFIRTSDIDDLGRLKIKGVYLKKEKVDKFYNLEDGDILISRSGTIGRSFLYNASNYEPATYAGYLVRFSLIKSTIYPKYIFYFLLSSAFKEWLKTQLIESTISNVNGRKYANLPILFFNKINQKRIANFLDQKTAKIDKLIQKNKKLIRVLEEKRQAVITQAVTKGLDPNVEIKDSGVAWLGKIPKSWMIKKWKFCLKLITKKGNENCNYKIALENVKGWIGEYLETDTVFEGSGTLFKKNDILFGKLRPYLAKVLLANQKGEAVGDILVYRVTKGIRPKFAFYKFISTNFINIINSSIFGAKMPRTSSAFINNLLFTYPSKKEQEKIVRFLDKKISRINSMANKVYLQNKKLEEYRQAIISNAVTGKIKI